MRNTIPLDCLDIETEVTFLVDKKIHVQVTLYSAHAHSGYLKQDQCRKISDRPLINLKELAALGTLFSAISALLKLGIDLFHALMKIVG